MAESLDSQAPPAPTPQIVPSPVQADNSRPAAPPAAVIVAGGPISENSARAQQELEETRAQLKKREQRVAELEDENKQLKTPPEPKKSEKQKKHFLDGWTLIQ